MYATMSSCALPPRGVFPGTSSRSGQFQVRDVPRACSETVRMSPPLTSLWPPYPVGRIATKKPPILIVDLWHDTCNLAATWGVRKHRNVLVGSHIIMIVDHSSLHDGSGKLSDKQYLASARQRRSAMDVCEICPEILHRAGS